MDPIFFETRYWLEPSPSDSSRYEVHHRDPAETPWRIELDPADGPVILAFAYQDDRAVLVQRNGRVSRYDLASREQRYQVRPLEADAVRAAASSSAGWLVLACHQGGETRAEKILLDEGLPNGSFHLPRACFRGHLQLTGVDTLMLYDQGRDATGQWYHGYHRLDPTTHERSYWPLPSPPRRHFGGRPPLLRQDFHLGSHPLWQPPRREADGIWYELNLFDLERLRSWRNLRARHFPAEQAPADDNADLGVFFDRLRLQAFSWDRPWIWCFWRDGALTRPGLYGAASPVVWLDAPEGTDPASLNPAFEDDHGLYLQSPSGGPWWRLALDDIDWEAGTGEHRLALQPVDKPGAGARLVWTT